MTPAAAIPSLVSLPRLGAALHAHRSASGMAAASLSRHCDGWWGPDDLLAVERGDWPLDDASVVSICHLYGLPGRGIPAAADLELVIDRTDSIELTDDSAAPQRATAELGLVRLAALGQLLGDAPLEDPTTIDVLSVAFEMSIDEISAALDHASGPAQDGVAAASAALANRVVVPTAGILIAATPSGSVVLTRRAGASWGEATPRTAAAGPLRWFVAPRVAAGAPVSSR